MRSKSVLLRTIFYFQLMLALMLLALGIITTANAQDLNGSNNIHSPQPKVNIQVHKEKDANGNLVRYDSVYTWSYSNGTIPADVLSGKLNAGLRPYKFYDCISIPTVCGAACFPPTTTCSTSCSCMTPLTNSCAACRRPCSVCRSKNN